MKGTIQSYAAIVLWYGAVLLCGCSVLTEEPKDAVPEEVVITDAASLYTNSVGLLYNYIGSPEEFGEGLQGSYRGYYDLQTFTSDEAIIPTRGGDWYDGGLWQQLYLHTWSEDNQAVENTWNYLYKVIVLCNRSLELLDDYNRLTDTTTLRAWHAEVRALRALYYTCLTDLFGHVPVVTASDIPFSSIRQQRRPEVYRFCIDELTEALPYLALERSNTETAYYGRMTRPVAWFVLMKLALNAEVWASDSTHVKGDEYRFDGEHNEWEAVMHYGELLTASGYSLAERQSDCFEVHNENCVENIFTIPMDKSRLRTRWRNQMRSMHYQHGAAYGYAGTNGSCATKETLRTFGYGTAEEDLRFRSAFYADTVCVNGQPLQLADGSTLVYHPEAVELDLSHSPYIATAGARMQKYAIDPTGLFDGTLRDNDIVLFRYADVLLMMAEAEMRSGKDGSKYLNEVRRRAGMPAREATAENILEERKLELVWEGWRRQDMIRFGTFTRGYSDRPQLSGEGETGGFSTVFPIPLSILDMNPLLEQNEGY